MTHTQWNPPLEEERELDSHVRRVAISADGQELPDLIWGPQASRGCGRIDVSEDSPFS